MLHRNMQKNRFERFNQKLPKLLVSDPNTLNWKSSIFMLLTSFNFGSKLILNDPKIDNLFNNLDIPLNWKEKRGESVLIQIQGKKNKCNQKT